MCLNNILGRVVVFPMQQWLRKRITLRHPIKSIVVQHEIFFDIVNSNVCLNNIQGAYCSVSNATMVTQTHYNVTPFALKALLCSTQYFDIVDSNVSQQYTGNVQ